MESNILDQLAAFDVRNKINFSIHFENSDEDEDVTNKAEKVINDNNRNNHDTSNWPACVLDPKNVIKEELPEISEEKSNVELGSKQNITQEITTVETENLQRMTANVNEERKRKQELLQIYKNKRNKQESTQENIKNYTQEKDTQKNSIDTSHLNHTNVAPTATIPSSNKSNEERETEKSKIKTYMISILTAVSENMRLVMEAYQYHKKYNTPYGSFAKQKIIYFNASYDTVVKLILPESKNKEFIMNFLHKTYQHALNRPSVSKYGFRDYEILLKELLDWAQDKQKSRQAAKNTARTATKENNTLQPILASPTCCQGSVLENPHNKPEVNATKSDTVCIFSGGSPGSEISINVNPNLSQHLSINYSKNNEPAVAQATSKSTVDLPRTQIPLQTQPPTQVNTKNKCLQELLEKPPEIQPSFPNVLSRQFPDMYKYINSTAGVPNQINKPLKIQNGHTTTGPSRHLPPQPMTPGIILQNQHPVNTTHKQPTLVPSSYGQLVRPPAPPSYFSTSWGQAWQQQVKPLQPELPNFQHIHPRYEQSNYIHKTSQHQHNNNMVSLYGQNQQIQTEIRQFQHVQQPQNAQMPTRQPQSIIPPNVNPHTQQPPPVLPECEKRLKIGDWHQGLNELYHPEQTQQQIDKNVPRTASTDSGFISPLNFNTSPDQTVPPVPEDTEPSQILITQVTSLNPNVPFMADGNCIMCKKTTKNVCMGCMKLYYCTYECQLQDWAKHGPECFK